MSLTVIFGSLVALLAMFCGIGYWLYRRGRNEGATSQRERDREQVDKMVKTYIQRAYNGNIGTDNFRVRNQGGWGDSSSTRVSRRMERRNGNGRKE